MSKKIKTEKIYRATAIPDREFEFNRDESLLQSKNEYDPDGNLILEITFNAAGNINEKNEYKYDAQGRQEISIIYSEEDEPLETRRTYYDEDGNVLKEEIIYLDGTVDSTEYHYKEGLLIDKVQKTDEEEIESRETFNYEDGRMVLYEKFNEDGKMVYQLKNTYKQSMIEETEIRSLENEQPSRQVIHYNKAGRRKEELHYDHRDRLVSRNQYEEDDQGRIIRVKEENVGSKNLTELMYDEQGRPKSQVETDVNGETVSQIERFYNDEGRMRQARVLYREPITGTLQENYLVYEYDYFD